MGISYEAADSKGLHEKLCRELNYSALNMALLLNYTNVFSLTQISQAIITMFIAVMVSFEIVFLNHEITIHLIVPNDYINIYNCLDPPLCAENECNLELCVYTQ